LNTICGTPVYIAPEIQFGDYDGAAVDIWSCGIILFVLLCGNTPWDEPSENSQEFCMFCTRPQLDYPPWNRLSAEVLHLLKGILNVYEDQRYKASQIKKHQWFSRKNYMMHENGKCNDPLALATRLFSQLAVENQQPVTGASQMSIDGDIMATQTQQHPVGADFGFSQPVFFAADSNPQFSARFDDTSFSQPAHAGLLSANNLQVRFINVIHQLWFISYFLVSKAILC
jgi:serine/threonine-protein kinase Chk1